MPCNKLSYCVLISAMLLLNAAGAKAQMQNISGMVTGNNERLSGAIIKNSRTNDEIISDIRGVFSIKAVSGDTILTSNLYFKTDTSVYNKQDYLIIQLKQITRVLKEVQIRDTLYDPLKVYNQNRKDYKDIYWKGDKSHIVSVTPVIGPEVGINVNIDKLYSALSKQGKDARRMQRTLTSDYRNSVVDQRFNKSIVSRVTGYKGEKLDNFIVTYRPSYDFITRATAYDIVQYIKKKYALDLKVKG